MSDPKPIDRVIESLAVTDDPQLNERITQAARQIGASVRDEHQDIYGEIISLGRDLLTIWRVLAELHALVQQRDAPGLIAERVEALREESARQLQENRERDARIDALSATAQAGPEIPGSVAQQLHDLRNGLQSVMDLQGRVEALETAMDALQRASRDP